MPLAFRSILVVCLGNICRSPVGERLLAANLPGMTIGSAGLHAMVGEPADPITQEAAAHHAIDLTGHVSRQMTAELGSGYDLILAMDKSHKAEIAARMPHLSGRTMLFGQWINGGVDVPDPYRRPIEIHMAAVSLVRLAGDAWITRLGGGRLT